VSQALYAIAIGLPGLIALVSFVGLPRCIAYFDDYDTQLPSLTILILKIPHIPLSFFCLFLIAALIFKEIKLKSQRSLTISMNLTVIVFSLLSLTIFLLAIWMPHVRIGKDF